MSYEPGDLANDQSGLITDAVCEMTHTDHYMLSMEAIHHSTSATAVLSHALILLFEVLQMI